MKSKMLWLVVVVLCAVVTAQGALVQTKVSTVITSGSNSAYGSDASDTDLINEGRATLLDEQEAAAYFGDWALNDGQALGNNPAVADAYEDTFYTNSLEHTDLPAETTFILDTSVNTAGYDITGITTIAGWQKNGASLADQKYELLVSTVGDAGFTSLGTIEYVPFTSTSTDTAASSKITLTDDTSVIASGVDAVRFIFQDHGQQSGTLSGTVYQEVDVFGAATVPEPATLVLLGMGGLLSLRRKK